MVIIMFYNSSKSTYELLGAYHVQRKPTPLVWDKNRRYAALSYRIKGSSNFFCDGQAFSADDGDILYIPAFVDYSHESEDEEILVIHLLCQNESEQTICHIHGTKELEQAFRNTVRCWQENGSYNRTMAALYQLFDALERQTSENRTVPAVIAPGVALLQKDFRDPNLTVAKLAEACYISQVYFRRLYRQHFGTSPLQTITDLRFKYAASLLRSGYYAPKQVAALSGFSDVKYFRTAFTRHFGMTPSEYRDVDSRIGEKP